MICDEAREAFTDLYDGRLSGPPLAALSQHLDGCRVCRQEWAAFRKAMRALQDLRDEEPSPGFALRVVARVAAPPRWRRAVQALVFPLRLKLPLHAAALVVVGLVGAWVFQRSPEVRQAVDLGAPPAAERFAAPPPLPVPDRAAPKQASEPRATVPPPFPPVGAAQPPASPPAPAAGKRETAPADRGTQAGPRALSGREEASPAVAPPPLAIQAPPEPAPSRLLRAAPTAEGSGSKAKSALQQEAGGAPKETEAARPPAAIADDLFSVAATEFAAQDYDGAIAHFRGFLEQHPKDSRAPDARFFLAEAYRARHRDAEASAEFAAFLAQYPDHRRAPVALYRQGETLLGMGDPAGCRVLRDALSRYPTAREAASGRETLDARCP